MSSIIEGEGILKGKDIPKHMGGKMHKGLADCPNIDNHIYGPEAYSEWHEWSKKMAKTHEQLKCKCGFYVIWESK